MLPAVGSAALREGVQRVRGRRRGGRGVGGGDLGGRSGGAWAWGQLQGGAGRSGGVSGVGRRPCSGSGGGGCGSFGTVQGVCLYILLCHCGAGRRGQGTRHRQQRDAAGCPPGRAARWGQARASSMQRQQQRRALSRAGAPYPGRIIPTAAASGAFAWTDPWVWLLLAAGSRWPTQPGKARSAATGPLLPRLLHIGRAEGYCLCCVLLVCQTGLTQRRWRRPC